MILILPALSMIMVLAPPGRMNRACEVLLGIVAAFFNVASGFVPRRPGGLGGGAPWDQHKKQLLTAYVSLADDRS